MGSGGRRPQCHAAADAANAPLTAAFVVRELHHERAGAALHRVALVQRGDGRQRRPALGELHERAALVRPVRLPDHVHLAQRAEGGEHRPEVPLGGGPGHHAHEELVLALGLPLGRPHLERVLGVWQLLLPMQFCYSLFCRFAVAVGQKSTTAVGAGLLVADDHEVEHGAVGLEHRPQRRLVQLARDLSYKKFDGISILFKKTFRQAFCWRVLHLWLLFRGSWSIC